MKKSVGGLGSREAYRDLGFKISARFLHRREVFLALVSHDTGMLTATGAGAMLVAFGLVLLVKMTVLMAEGEVGLLELNLLDLLLLALMLLVVLLIGG